MEKQEKILEAAKVVLAQEDCGSELPISAMLAKSSVPFSHRRIADNYNIMKRIYGFQVVQPRISNTERNLLYKYHFNTLENTPIALANVELALLKQWSTSVDDKLRADSDTLLQTRVKELKFILSNKYGIATNELFNGYKAVELYLDEITKFYSAN